MEAITLTQILTIAGTTAAPIVATGIAAVVTLKTKVRIFAERNKEDHDEIKARLDKQNGHISESQKSIASARREIEAIKSTCTERGRLEKEIRSQINQELRALKE